MGNEIKKQTYLLIRMSETDGDILIDRLTKKEIKEKVENLHRSDYVIIKGKVLKDFESKTFMKLL